MGPVGVRENDRMKYRRREKVIRGRISVKEMRESPYGVFTTLTLSLSTLWEGVNGDRKYENESVWENRSGTFSEQYLTIIAKC